MNIIVENSYIFKKILLIKIQRVFCTTFLNVNNSVCYKMLLSGDFIVNMILDVLLLECSLNQYFSTNAFLFI